jgi:prevent-host-death family protein
MVSAIHSNTCRSQQALRNPSQEPITARWAAPAQLFVGHKQLDIRSDFGTIIEPEVNIMNIVNDIKPVTYLKSRAADLLKQINETQRPVIITQNGEPRAVLQDPVSYENMRNAIGILKLISQGEVDIRCGRTKPQEKMFDEIENSLNERLK